MVNPYDHFVPRFRAIGFELRGLSPETAGSFALQKA